MSALSSHLAQAADSLTNLIDFTRKLTIDNKKILKNNDFSNAKTLFDLLSIDKLVITYSIDHTKDSKIIVYDLNKNIILKECNFYSKSIDNLKVVNNKILLHLSYEADDCLIIMDEKLQLEKTKEEFGFSDLAGANESFIYTFNYYSSCLIVFDWSFKRVETNLYFQTMDLTEPFYIECKTINKLNFFDFIENTYVLNLKVDNNEHKIFLFDKDGVFINSFKSTEIISTKMTVLVNEYAHRFIIAVFENNSIKLFDNKGNKIEIKKTLEFDFNQNQIDKFIICNEKIYFLDKNNKIHIKGETLIKNYKMSYNSQKKFKSK